MLVSIGTGPGVHRKALQKDARRREVQQHQQQVSQVQQQQQIQASQAAERLKKIGWLAMFQEGSTIDLQACAEI